MEKGYILITRPVTKTAETAAMVDVAGFTPFSEPMLEIVPVADSPLPDDLTVYDGLILTSPNAVRVLAEMTKDRYTRLYAVGQDTAAEAEKRGWTDIISANGTGEDLAALLECEQSQGRPFLHLSGRYVSYAFDEDKKIKAERRVIYDAVKIKSLTPDCRRLIEERKITAILFYSARTAENFEALADAYGLTDALSSIKALCIGKRVVNSLRNELWQDVRCACTPDSEGMKTLLNELAGIAEPK